MKKHYYSMATVETATRKYYTVMDETDTSSRMFKSHLEAMNALKKAIFDAKDGEQVLARNI